MVAMKSVLILACCGMTLAGADLASVHSVYLMPMGSALDQYLANRLTSEHVFHVVTDPKLADAVFTDRIGDAFEEKLADLTAPPPSEKPAASKPDDQKGAAKQSKPLPPTLPTETVNKLSDPALNSSFGHSKGTIFLVDIKSKQVVWSVFDPPKNTTGAQLDRSAADIVSRLKRDLNKPEGGK